MPTPLQTKFLGSEILDLELSSHFKVIIFNKLFVLNLTPKIHNNLSKCECKLVNNWQF